MAQEDRNNRLAAYDIASRFAHDQHNLRGLAADIITDVEEGPARVTHGKAEVQIVMEANPVLEVIADAVAEHRRSGWNDLKALLIGQTNALVKMTPAQRKKSLLVLADLGLTKKQLIALRSYLGSFRFDPEKP